MTRSCVTALLLCVAPAAWAAEEAAPAAEAPKAPPAEAPAPKVEAPKPAEAKPAPKAEAPKPVEPAKAAAPAEATPKAPPAAAKAEAAPAAPAPKAAPVPAPAAPAKAEAAPQPKAESAAAPEPKPAAPAVVAQPAPAANPVEAKAAPKKPVDDSLATSAKLFYEALLRKDVDTLAGLSHAPFFFEGKQAQSTDEIKKRWATALQSKSVQELKLYGIDTFTAEEMTEKYGKAPEKLRDWPIKGGMLTVANIGGHAAVVLWRQNGKGWQAQGFHD